MSDFESFSDLDRLIHEPGRLVIAAVLNAVDQADFLFLLKQTGLTRGNLSSHTAKLETAGYLDIEKTFVEKVPRTVYRLTPAGREALNRYRRHMGQVLKALDD